MRCRIVTLPGGDRAFVCGSRRSRPCSVCGRPASLLCDYPDSGHKSGTCDQPLCPRCSVRPAGTRDKDFCPRHPPVAVPQGDLFDVPGGS
ncbi:MAG: hypothetical protein AB7P52_17685 [Alphaproteobacteria bacterium]